MTYVGSEAPCGHGTGKAFDKRGIKAVITDLDNTLLHSDKTVSEYTCGIIKKLRERNTAFIIATARPYRSAEQFIRPVKPDAFVTMNGAKIFLRDGEIGNGIKSDSAKIILANLTRRRGATISIESDNGIYSNAEIPEWRTKVFNTFPELPEGCGTIYKILVSFQGAAADRRRAIIENSLTADTYYTVAEGNLFQIMGAAATKWNGVCAALKSLGISTDEVIYFGDDNDDIGPIKNCRYGVAVKNAIPAVLSEADYVAYGNDDDGVAKFIEEYLL